MVIFIVKKIVSENILNQIDLLQEAELSSSRSFIYRYLNPAIFRNAIKYEK